MKHSDLLPWRIWTKTYNSEGKLISGGVSAQTYTRKGNAERTARRMYDSPNRSITTQWIVAKENPWKNDIAHPDVRHRMASLLT